jgi:ADP-ribose pyrophosphatase
VVVLTQEKTVWSGKYLSVHVKDTWEYVDRAQGLSAAVIVAFTDRDELILIEEYRVPLGRPCLGFPAGIVGDDVTGEDPIDSARRELEEETGYRAESMEPLGEFASSPGLTSECFTLFRARGLQKVGDGGGLADEDITVRLVPRQDVADFVGKARGRGLAIDVKLMAALPLF